jgi:hypothetical protein
MVYDIEEEIEEIKENINQLKDQVSEILELLKANFKNSERNTEFRIDYIDEYGKEEYVPSFEEYMSDKRNEGTELWYRWRF